MPPVFSAGFGLMRRPGESVCAPIIVRPRSVSGASPTMKAMIEDPPRVT